VAAGPREGWRRRLAVRVYYDGWCTLCRRSAGTLRRLDWLGVLELVSFRDEGVAERDGLDLQRLERRMQARPAAGGPVREGMDAVVLVAARLPLLWPVWPLLVAARWTGIGRAAYDWIAARRHRGKGP
jgi:predicted DCC family thiol-disulfide oxidoreductase YuxK